MSLLRPTIKVKPSLPLPTPSPTITPPSNSTPLEKLKNRLIELEASQPRLVFSLAELNTKESIAKAKATLAKTGVLFVTNALPEIQQEQNPISQRIVDSFNQMFAADGLDHVEQLSDIPPAMKAGIIGNKSFGYLYKQPMTKATTNTTKIDGSPHPVYITQNPVYKNVNLATMTAPENRQLLSVLLALTHTNNVLLSWDSVKVATQYKSGANPFTVPHVDHYQNHLDRYQAILNPFEQKTKLFYAPNTVDPEVRSLIEIIQNDTKIYVTDGFKKLSSEIFKIVRPFMRAAPPNSLTIWRSGVIHAEQTATPIPADSLYYPDPDNFRQFSNQLAVRLVIGTHKALGLTTFSKKQLAVAAQHGVIPSRYQHGKHPAVVENKMHKGKTLYRKSRPQPQSEKELLESIGQLIQDPEQVELEFDALDPIIKHISGIDQPEIWPELAELLDG